MRTHIFSWRNKKNVCIFWLEKKKKKKKKKIWNYKTSHTVSREANILRAECPPLTSFTLIFVSIAPDKDA